MKYPFPVGPGSNILLSSEKEKNEEYLRFYFLRNSLYGIRRLMFLYRKHTDPRFLTGWQQTAFYF